MAFTDASFKDSNIELEVWTDYFTYTDGDERKLHIAFRSTTEAYYEYMTMYNIHSWNQYPDLFTGEPVPMYTNIENGLGFLERIPKRL